MVLSDNPNDTKMYITCKYLLMSTFFNSMRVSFNPLMLIVVLRNFASFVTEHMIKNIDLHGAVEGIEKIPSVAENQCW